MHVQPQVPEFCSIFYGEEGVLTEVVLGRGQLCNNNLSSLLPACQPGTEMEDMGFERGALEAEERGSAPCPGRPEAVPALV